MCMCTIKESIYTVQPNEQINLKILSQQLIARIFVVIVVGGQQLNNSVIQCTGQKFKACNKIPYRKESRNIEAETGMIRTAVCQLSIDRDWGETVNRIMQQLFCNQSLHEIDCHRSRNGNDQNSSLSALCRWILMERTCKQNYRRSYSVINPSTKQIVVIGTPLSPLFSHKSF